MIIFLVTYLHLTGIGVVVEELPGCAAATSFVQVHRVRSREGRTTDGTPLQVPRQSPGVSGLKLFLCQ